MESEWDKGFKAGFKMCCDMDQKGLENAQKAIVTLASWIAQSAVGALHADEVNEIEKIVRGEK